jgi:hypothetical protein
MRINSAQACFPQTSLAADSPGFCWKQLCVKEVSPVGKGEPQPLSTGVRWKQAWCDGLHISVRGIRY